MIPNMIQFDDAIAVSSNFELSCWDAKISPLNNYIYIISIFSDFSRVILYVLDVKCLFSSTLL